MARARKLKVMEDADYVEFLNRKAAADQLQRQAALVWDGYAAYTNTLKSKYGIRRRDVMVVNAETHEVKGVAANGG